MDKVLVSQAQIRTACNELQVPLSNSLFNWYKTRGTFPNADVGNKVARYALYYFENAVDIIGIWMGAQEIEMPRDFIRDKLIEVVNGQTAQDVQNVQGISNTKSQ